MRIVVTLAIGWCALGLRDGVSDRRINLPSSLDRKKEPVPVHVHHRHQAVLTCLPQAQDGDSRCVPTHQRRNASTSLRLDPVRARKSRNRTDSREPVHIRITAEGAPVVSPVLVGAGAWDVVWPGLQASKRFSVEDGQAVRLELETTRGRCERVASQCFLRDNVVTKNVEVTVR